MSHPASGENFSSDLPRECAHVVIGGGLFGCSIAYHLARKNKEVIVLERRNICSGASGRNGGQVIQLEGRDRNEESIKRRLALTGENNRMLQGLSRELDVELEYHRTGSLDIALTEGERQELEEIVRIQKKAGDREVEFLGREETLRLCPVLTTEIKGARYRASDGTINPFLYTHGFAKNVVRLGGAVFPHTEVKKILKKKGKVQGVETSSGKKIRAGKVINATNAWSSLLVPEIDILPLRQIAAVTEPASALPICPVEAFLDGEAVYTNIQPGSGNLVAGGLRALAMSRQGQYDETVYQPEVTGAARVFSCLYPGLGDLSIIRAWAGTMALGPDFLPVIGKVPEIEGLYLSAGFYNGMAYACIIGELVSEMVITDKVPAPLVAFGPEKYYRKNFRWPTEYNCTSLSEFFART